MVYLNLLNEQEIKVINKANPLTSREYPSLANFMDSHILATGGNHPSNDQALESVEIYNIEMDTWE